MRMSRQQPSDVRFYSSLQVLYSPGPVVVQQAGQTAVSQQTSSGLAPGTVVRFVACVPNPLNFGAAHGAGLTEAAVNRHSVTKCRDFFGKFPRGFSAKAVDPLLKYFAGRG